MWGDIYLWPGIQAGGDPQGKGDHGRRVRENKRLLYDYPEMRGDSMKHRRRIERHRLRRKKKVAHLKRTRKRIYMMFSGVSLEMTGKKSQKSMKQMIRKRGLR